MIKMFYLKIFKKIVRYLSERHPDIYFANFSDVLNGLSYADGSVIYLDPRKDILPTLIHECLHAVYPYASENLVVLVERKLTKWLEEPEWTLLLELLYFNLGGENV